MTYLKGLNDAQKKMLSDLKLEIANGELREKLSNAEVEILLELSIARLKQQTVEETKEIGKDDVLRGRLPDRRRSWLDPFRFER